MPFELSTSAKFAVFFHDPERCANTKSLRINHRFWICFQFGHSGNALCWQLAPQCLSIHKTFIESSAMKKTHFSFLVQNFILNYYLCSGIGNRLHRWKHSENISVTQLVWLRFTCCHDHAVSVSIRFPEDNRTFIYPPCVLTNAIFLIEIIPYIPDLCRISHIFLFHAINWIAALRRFLRIYGMKYTQHLREIQLWKTLKLSTSLKSSNIEFNLKSNETVKKNTEDIFTLIGA